MSASHAPLLGAVTMIAIGMAVSPGQDFALIVRQSLLHSRRAGLYTSFGIASAVWLHVAYCVTGLAILLVQWPAAAFVVRWLGAGYLVYLGLINVFAPGARSASQAAQSTAPTAGRAFCAGFLCNALNPKTTLFFLSLFTQVIRPSTPIAWQLACGLIISLAHLLWFGALSIGLSTPRLARAIWRVKRPIEAAVGVMLILVALYLVRS